MKVVAIAALALVLLLASWVVTRKPPSIDEELGKLVAEERKALEEVAAGAGIPVRDLRPVGPGVLQHNPRAVAVQDGHVVELRLSHAPIRQLGPLGRLTRLRSLWLDGCALESLEGIESLRALRTLDLSGSRLTDVSALTSLPELETLDLRGSPIQRLPSPVPARWKVTSDLPATAPVSAPAAAPRPERPASWVEALPKPTGEGTHGPIEGVVTNGAWTVRGSVPRLNGVVKVDRIPGVEEIGGGDTTLELEVANGRVKAYLESAIPDPGARLGRRVGYVSAEATPGRPVTLVGTLRSFGPGSYGMARAYELTLESVGGEATGVRYRLYHR